MIRGEKPSDANAIRAVHCSAFPSVAEGDLVDRLRSTGNLLVSLVAEHDKHIVGHVAFSKVIVEPTSPECGVGLAPVAVLPSWQRQRIGSQLIEQGIAECRDAGYAFVVVLGAPVYYLRFGFQPASSFGLDDEYGAKMSSWPWG